MLLILVQLVLCVLNAVTVNHVMKMVTFRDVNEFEGKLTAYFMVSIVLTAVMMWLSLLFLFCPFHSSSDCISKETVVIRQVTSSFCHNCTQERKAMAAGILFLLSLLFTLGHLQLQYPVGDIRNCPTSQLKNPNASLFTMDALPGLGFDNLRNLDTGRVFSMKYASCQISGDGQYLLPDDVFLVPILNSEVDLSAQIFEHFDDWKSTTATSINVEAKYGSAFSKVSGKFSTDYQDTKTKMVNSKSRSVRVGLRHHLYSAHVNPDAELHPSFKSRVLEIAANIQNNNTRVAHYLTDLLVRDYGTHVVTSIDVGASLYQTTFLLKSSSQTTESTQLNISASATASFFSSFSISTNFKFSQSHVDTEGYSSSTTHSHVSTHGGPPFRLGNFSYTDWEADILDHLVAIDRRGEPIYTAISSSNLPELPDVLLLETMQYIYKSVTKYYKINTHCGCTDPDSPNFSFQANIDDNSCSMIRQNHSFGGIYQTCVNNNDYDVCTLLSLEQRNPLTNDFSCPTGYTSVLLHTDAATTPYIENDCTRHCGIFHISCHENCNKRTVIKHATYNAYWCVFPPKTQAPSDSGYVFGGVYTSKEQNPLTGARSCPMFFYPLHFGKDISVCVSNDIEAESLGIPFGGFESCQTGNPLASSPKQFSAGIYPHNCPMQYNQFLAAVDQGCVINYCSVVEAFKKQLPHPPRLPPYKIKADLSINVSNTLVITGPYGSLWVKETDGTWTKYTEGQYTSGTSYLKSLSSNGQVVDPITGNVESASTSRAVIAGLIIGTVITTLLTVAFIAFAVFGVKKYKRRQKMKKMKSSQRYMDLEDTFESTTEVDETTQLPAAQQSKDDPLVRELTLRIQNQ